MRVVIPENLFPTTSVSCLHWMFCICLALSFGSIDSVHLLISILALVAFSYVLMISVTFSCQSSQQWWLFHYSHIQSLRFSTYWVQTLHPCRLVKDKLEHWEPFSLISRATCCSRQGYLARGDIWKEKTSFNFFLDKPETDNLSKFQNLRVSYLWRHILQC